MPRGVERYSPRQASDIGFPCWPGIKTSREACVGTGCMKAEDNETYSRLQTAANAAKRLRSLLTEKAAFDAKLAVWEAVWQEVCALPLPPTRIEDVVHYGNRPGRDLIMGDVAIPITCWGDIDIWTNGPSRERLACVTNTWRRQRMRERNYQDYRPFSYRDFDKMIRRAQAAIAQAM